MVYRQCIRTLFQNRLPIIKLSVFIHTSGLHLSTFMHSQVYSNQPFSMPLPCQVVEAVLEDVGLKQRIFADLEKACRPDCILSSNTSTIDISVIGQKTRAADRIVGAHFFSPAHIMPLLEIVRTDKTSPQVRLVTS